MQNKILLSACFLLVTSIAHAQSSWVDKLQNDNGNICCYDNDGRRLDDVDWDNLGKVTIERLGTSGYRVFEDGKWYDVPNWAMVNQKNLDGIPRVWWDRHYEPDHQSLVSKTIRCFLKGVEG